MGALMVQGGPSWAGLLGVTPVRSLGSACDGLADVVEKRLDVYYLARLADVP
jgi:hypothetical protein